MLVSLFTFFLFSFVLNHLHVWKTESVFISSVINLLLVTGIYALVVTRLQSVFLIPVLLIVFLGILQKKFYFRIRTREWTVTALFAGFISIVFWLVFWRNGGLLLPHVDYLFMIRMGITNQQLGVENVGIFYNLIAPDYPRVELYHYLEGWDMNLATKLNGQHPAYNFFFFSYPLGAIIACVGIRELVTVLFPQFSRTSIIAGVLFVFTGFLFFTHPWDLLTEAAGLKSMPVASIGYYWRGFKMIYVIITVIPVLMYLKTKKEEWVLTAIPAAFVYLPVLAILYVTFAGWFVYLFFKGKKPSLFSIVFLLISGASVVVFYKVFSSGGYMLSGFDLFEWFKAGSIRRYLPAILMKAFLIPLVCLAPFLFYFFINRKKYPGLFGEPLLFILLLYTVCMGVWAVFVKNINANQSFILLFGALLTLTVFITTWYFLQTKKYIAGVLLAAVYMLPELVHAISFKSPLAPPDKKTEQFVSEAGNAKILYLPDSSDMTNIYAYYESIYTGIDPFILKNRQIQLFSAAAAYQVDTTTFNPITLTTYQHVRNHSPYFKECGYLNFASPCVADFVKKHGIDYVCVKTGVPAPSNWQLVSAGNDYQFYRLK